jgi:hypothetical protein
LIEGFPSANAYINRENKPVASLRVFANNVEFLSKREDDVADDYSRGGGGEPVYSLPEAGSSANVNTLTSDNIPF